MKGLLKLLDQLNRSTPYLRNIGGFTIGTTFLLLPTIATAQIQRSFINPSFEQPTFGSAGQRCYVQVSPSTIPGWETTHGAVRAGNGNCSGYTSPGVTPLIEIWTSGFNSAFTAANAGNQFAELNAEQSSQLYQNLCLYQGETINFSFLHRGRSSSSAADVANFLIGLNTDPSPTIFGRFSTTNNGTVTAQPVAQNGATIPPVSNNNAGNGWVRYNGTVPYNGVTGNRPVGFAAVSAGTLGNFLDETQFAGKPVVEFYTTSGGGPEAETNPTTNPPQLRIVGLVPAGGLTVPITVSGTATVGTDFNTTSGTSTFNMTIPAGNYDGSNATSLFSIPFTVNNNNIPQGSRLITFTLQPSSNFFASSTTTCGGSPIIASDYTIYDDDFISGTVWNDVDNSANNTFTNINTASETGTNASGLLYAILVDSSNNVLKTTPVAADGTYTFLDVPLNQTNVRIILSTTPGTVNNPAPVPALPANWVNTSPLATAAFNTGNNIANRDFGIRSTVPPTIDLDSNDSSGATNSDYQNVFTANGPPVSAADIDVAISDDGTTIGSATITLTNRPNGNSESLTIDPTAGGSVTGISASAYNSSTGVITLTGSASLAAYQAVIATLTYDNNAAAPATTDRIIEVQVTDSDNRVSNTAVSRISIQSTGVVPNPHFNGSCQTGFKVALILDASGSVDNTELQQTRDGVKAFLNQLATLAPGKVEVGIVEFALRADLAVDFTPVTSTTIAGVFSNYLDNQLPDRQTNWSPVDIAQFTNWEAAFATAQARLPGADIVLFTTDGDPNKYLDDNGNPQPSGTASAATALAQTVPWANQLKFAGAHIYAVGITNGVSVPGNFYDLTDGNPGSEEFTGSNAPTADYLTVSDYAAFGNALSSLVDGLCGAVSSNPNVLLVKRITAVNGVTTTNAGDNLALYQDEASNPYDDNTVTITTPPATASDPPQDTDKWPDPNTFLIGGINGGIVMPNDEIEYTIYFLSAGDNDANNVLLCDRVPENATYLPTAYSAGATLGMQYGIQLNIGGTITNLTGTQDSDVGQFFPIGVEPTTVFPNINCGGSNTNGAVVVNLGNLPHATAPSTPLGSYGFVRFKGKIK